MAHDEDDADGQSEESGTTAADDGSCRLCCDPLAADDRRFPILAATDDGQTRPGGGLHDTILKHLRIEVSERRRFPRARPLRRQNGRRWTRRDYQYRRSTARRCFVRGRSVDTAAAPLWECRVLLLSMTIASSLA